MNKEPSILVVGASGVIGSAVARELDRTGYRVGLHYCSNLSSIELLLSESLAPDQHTVFQSSLHNIKDADALLDNFFQKMPNLTGLALCGGRVPWKAERELTEDDWYQAYKELAIIPFHLARGFIDRCSLSSKIVGLSSISARYGGSERSRHYGAAKSAFETALFGLSREAASREISINVVRAGFVLSPQQSRGRTSEELSARASRVPFQRAGLPEEIGHIFSMLLDPRSSFMTGQCISVAGGD